ncbi:hypothetical protein [Sulfurospirillum sp. 1612]|uniref:hypothetical protein n=1 Tax=Sulfurospirillum sp. 1612 TaxID=3094835 RepID=UPI002F942B48
MKFNEKALRVKYMRLLEKFVKSCETILKLEDFNYLLFEKKITKIYQQIQKLDDLHLDSTYLNTLKSFTDFTIRILENEKMTTEEKRILLLKEVNQTRKQKNSTSYKKEKHKKQLYDD